jgi:hypothetical protein
MISLTGFIVFYTALFIIEMFLMFKFARIGPSSLHTGRTTTRNRAPTARAAMARVRLQPPLRHRSGRTDR